MHRFFLILLILSSVSGCRRQVSEPEKIDPIYLDMLSEVEKAKKTVADTEKEILDIKKDLEKAEPQTGQVRTITEDLNMAKNNLEKANQMLKYAELRVKTRREVARQSYLKAFESERDWPDPEEFRLYKVNKGLATAPRSWDRALQARLPKKEVKKEEKKKPAASSGH